MPREMGGWNDPSRMIRHPLVVTGAMLAFGAAFRDVHATTQHVGVSLTSNAVDRPSAVPTRTWIRPALAPATIGRLKGDNTMRALQIRPEGLVYEEVPEPAIGPADVLIRVEAAGINYMDTNTFLNASPEDMPMPLGGEAGGKVVAIGSDCHRHCSRPSGVLPRCARPVGVAVILSEFQFLSSFTLDGFSG